MSLILEIRKILYTASAWASPLMPHFFPKHWFVLFYLSSLCYLRAASWRIQAHLMNDHTQTKEAWQTMLGAPQSQDDTVNCSAQQDSQEDSSLSVKVPKDTKSLATFKSFACFLHGVGGNSLLSGKNHSPGPIRWLRSSKKWLRQEQIFPFPMGMTHEIVYSKSYILHWKRWMIGELDDNNSWSSHWSVHPLLVLHLSLHSSTSTPPCPEVLSVF